MVWWTAQNMVISAALAALIWLICRAFRLGPVARHALWLLVLAKLLTPPLVVWPWAIHDPLASLSATSDRILQQVTPGNNSMVAPQPVWLDEPADTDSEFSASSSPTPEGSAAPDPQATSSALHSASSHTSWMKWLLILAGTIWSAGAVVVGLVQLSRIGRMWLRVNRSDLADAAVCRRVSELAARLGVQPIEVREVAGVGSPVIWSLLRPRLLWPVELSAAELSPQSLSGLIVHELAHVWRRDHWVGWAELLAECVWWWNPLFWYVRHQLRENAELACDAWVVQTLPSGRRAYAEGLLTVCESMSRRVVPMPAVGIGTGGRRFLERRLTMILRGHTPLRLPRIGLLTVAMLAATALPAWSQKSGEADADQGSTARRQSAFDEAFGRVNTAAKDYDPKAGIRDVDPGLATLREDVIGRLRTLQQMYARAGMAQEAAEVAQCLRTLAARTGSARVQPDPGTLMKYRGQVGQSFYFDVRGATGPTIWGSGVYTDDSPLAAAAVHAGVLRDGVRGIVKVTILPGQSSYAGSTRNGVQSESWNAWDGSYRVEPANVAIDRPRADQGLAPGDLVTLHDPGTLTSFRDKVGQSFTFDVVGSAEGTIWGSGQYTDDSPLAVAAVHAGVLRPGERGRIRVTILPGREQYEGSTHNGITSLAYGSFDGSYRIDGLRRRLTPEGTVTPTLEHLRDQVGQTFTIDITGSTEGQVWGDGVYTDDSSLPAAAVHAGVLRPGERGRIAVTILPGQPHYEGTTHHGITSQPWEGWGGSYRLYRVTE